MTLDIYRKVVCSITDGLAMKRVHNAADIVSIKNCIASINSFDNNCKFELLFILHQLWTPLRMRFFVKNYNISKSVVESIIGVDSSTNLTKDFEDANLRAGLIKGQTNERSILELLTTHVDVVREICQYLERNWNTLSIRDKICLFKSIPHIGNYHATHLVRSLSYVLNTSLDGISWSTLQRMSQGVSFVKEQLGEYCMETPAKFAEKLSIDTNEKIEIGDIAIIFCEINSAQLLLKYPNVRTFSKEQGTLIRNHLHKIHNISNENEQLCYISAKNLLRYMEKFNISITM